PSNRDALTWPADRKTPPAARAALLLHNGSHSLPPAPVTDEPGRPGPARVSVIRIQRDVGRNRRVEVHVGVATAAIAKTGHGGYANAATDTAPVAGDIGTDD